MGLYDTDVPKTAENFKQVHDILKISLSDII